MAHQNKTQNYNQTQKTLQEYADDGDANSGCECCWSQDGMCSFRECKACPFTSCLDCKMKLFICRDMIIEELCPKCYQKVLKNIK